MEISLAIFFLHSCRSGDVKMEEGEKMYEQAWIGLKDKEKEGISFQVKTLALLL